MIFTLNELLSFFYAFVRLGVLLMGLPFFSGKIVPFYVRVSLAGLLAYLMSDHIDLGGYYFHSFGLFLGCLNELLCGFLLVLGGKMVFYAIEFAGQLMASEMGLAMSASFNPSMDSSATSMSQLLFYFAIVMAFIAEVPQAFLLGFVKSFQVVPAGGFFLEYVGMMPLIKASTGLFVLGVQIAAPIIAINFLVNIVFAILGKAVPRMNVFVTSFSVRIAAGFLMLFLTVLLITQIFSDSIRLSADQAFQLLNI